MSTGLYIHVPFCLRKCPYCDFYSVKYNAATAEQYVQAVCRNVEKYADRGISVDTIYFGGGTPSLLEPEQIGLILNTADRTFTLCDTEITLEANPCSVDKQKLYGYMKAGVNRLSFGVQSANDKQLGFLGRLHDFEQAENAVYNAASAGFDKISCDLMLGMPGQTADDLALSIKHLTDLPIEHISAYMLKIEEGTPFDREDIKSSVADDDMQCELYLKAVELLREHGFEQYEISNFAKNKKYSRHNLKYWRGQDYLGIGPAAYSMYNGKRYHVPADVDKFIAMPYQQEIVDEESINAAEEYIMLSLRLKWGISLSKVKELAGDKAAEMIRSKAQRFANAGLCRTDNDRVALTPKGFLVSNSIISELADF